MTGGARFDRSPGTTRRKLRAIQSLSAVIERGELIGVNEDTGLAFVGDPAALSLLSVAPISLSDAGVSLTLATDPGLEVDSGGLRVDVVAPITRTSAGVGLGLSTAGGLEVSGSLLQINLDSNPGLQLSASGLAIDLDADPQLTLGAGGLAFDDTDALSFGWMTL